MMRNEPRQAQHDGARLPDAGLPAHQQVAIDNAIAAHGQRPGGLLPLLNAILDTLGYVPRQAIARIAQALNLSQADVHGVISFYHDFRAQPPGKRVLRLCRAEACQSMGADALADSVRQALGIDFGATTADGAITLEAVYCLGNCACAPAAMLDGEVHGRLSDDRLRALLQTEGAGR